jgi:hypothetical protein
MIILRAYFEREDLFMLTVIPLFACDRIQMMQLVKQNKMLLLSGTEEDL